MHVVVLHSTADAGAAGSVAAVLGDLSAYTLEVRPGKLPLRFGPNVVPVAIYSPTTGDQATVAAIAASLAKAQDRAVVFAFTGADPPDEIKAVAAHVLYQTSDGEGDQVRLREAIARVTPAIDPTRLPRTTEDAPSARSRGPGGFLLGLVLGCAIGAAGAIAAMRLELPQFDAGANVQAPEFNKTHMKKDQ